MILWGKISRTIENSIINRCCSPPILSYTLKGNLSLLFHYYHQAEWCILGILLFGTWFRKDKLR
jgi:hypothetical protein